MLLSFSEVAAAAVEHIEAAAHSPEASAALQQRADDWRALVNRDFFNSYRRSMKGHALFPAHARAADTLVTLFMVEKAAASVSNSLAQHSKTMGAAMRRLVQLSQRKR